MRPALLLLIALSAAACDSPPPTLRAAHAETEERPARLPVGDLLGVAVRNGVGGVMIVGIDLEGPLAGAGALVGDFIVAVNGGAVGSEAELAALVAAAARTGTISLDIWRQGLRKQVAVAVAPPANDTRLTEEAKGALEAPERLGFYVRELPANALKEIGLAFGVMVTKVRPPADRSRLMAGDVIVGINQTPIRSLEEFNRLLAQHAHGPINLLVRRADSDLYIALDAGSSAGGSRPPKSAPGKRKPTGTPLRT